MKKTPYAIRIALLLFGFFSSFVSAQVPLSNDSLSLSWEHMDGPSAYISKYAQQGDVLFAAGEEVLFTSFDGGQHWLINEPFGRKRIRQLYANEDVILVITEEAKVLQPGASFPTIDIHQVYRSIDGGFSWEKVLGLLQYPEVAGPNTPYEIVAKNDSVLGFNYQQFFDGWIVHNHFYYTSDLGHTWKYHTENASLLDAHNDTIVYVKTAANGPIPEVKISGKTDFSDTKTIPLSGTTASWSNLKKVAYLNGVVYLFLSDKSLWRSYDDGQSWISDQLMFSGNLEEVIWEDSVFYLKSSIQVSRATSNDYLSLSTVSPAKIKTFTALSSGFWINNEFNQTQFLQTGTTSWKPMSVGLSSHVGALKLHCDGLLAQSIGKGTDEGGWYFSNGVDIKWEQQAVPLNCCILGTFNGFLFHYWAPFLYRSNDCGASWQVNGVPFEAEPSGMIAHNGKLFVYSSLDQVLHFSSNSGNSWNTGSLPNTGIYQMFTAGPYLMAIGSKIYRSANDGQTWEILDKPFDANIFYSNGNQLLGTYSNKAPDGQVNIYSSPDYGINWTQTAHFVPDTCGFYWQFAKDIKAVSDSLIFLHYDNGLYVSGNQGLDWTRISQVPFSKRTNQFCVPYVQDTFIGQAERYFFDSGYVYASTEAHGLWRTPLKPIHDYLYQASATKIPAAAALTIFPNPAQSSISVQLPTGFSDATLNIVGMDGRLQLARNVLEFELGHQLSFSVENWPMGMYFIILKTDHQVFQGLFSKQ